MKNKYVLYERNGQSLGEIGSGEALESLCQDLEYGDVADGLYVVLDTEYILKPDRPVSDSDYYTTPYTSKGTMWLPKFGDELQLDSEM